MKVAQRFALPLVLALGAGAAMAQGPIEGNQVFNFQSQLSRAEVRADAVAANKAGLIARGEVTPVQAAVADIGLSRAEVRAQAAQAHRDGQIARGEIAFTGA